MVSTRHHPTEFDGTPAPTPQSSLRAPSSRSSDNSLSSPTQAVATRRSKAPSSSSASAAVGGAWSHTPSIATLVWLAISLPLVIWDTGYVLGRPHTMPGGSLHWPLYTPYALYGTVDYVYGFPALESHSGFTGAQGALNAIETAGYIYYLYLVLARGHSDLRVKGRGAPAKGNFLTKARVLTGRDAAVAVLVAFSMAVMTLSKTVLYWLNEYYSGFANIGHNSIVDLIPLWIIPNGAWLIFPTYMIYVFGAEILQGLEASTGATKKSK